MERPGSYTLGQPRHWEKLGQQNSSLNNRQAAIASLCRIPRNPRMSDISARLSSFHNWPNHIKATPRELADAGFFYLGERDRTKCYYCNGGLQIWKRDDDPYYEHAKWYPECAYIRAIKGAEYVDSVAKRYPQLNRPTIVKTSAAPKCNPVNMLPVSTGMREVLSDTTVSSSAPALSNNSMKSIDARINSAMESDVVKDAAKMGFDDEMIKDLVKRKLLAENYEYSSLLNLIEDLQAEEETRHEDTSSSCEQSESTSLTAATSSSADTISYTVTSADDVEEEQSASKFSVHHLQMTSSSNQVPAGLLLLNGLPSNAPKIENAAPRAPERPQDGAVAEIRKEPQPIKRKEEAVYQNLLDEQTCKICLDRKSDCLFLPCRHLCCCTECGPALQFCPICRCKLDKLIKIYRKK